MLYIKDILKTYIDYNNPVAWDTETTGFNVFTDTIVGIGICWELEGKPGLTDNNIGCYIPITDSLYWNNLVIRTLTPFITSSNYPKVLHNEKYDRQMFECDWGLVLDGVVNDTMINHYILAPHKSHGLKYLSVEYLKHYSESYEEVIGKKDIKDIPIEKVAKYCIDDTWNTKALHHNFDGKLDNARQSLLEDVELPLIRILSNMELEGLCIDSDWVQEESIRLGARLEEINIELCKLAGREININSAPQLRQFIFKDLGIPETGVKYTKTGEISTDKETLKRLEGLHPALDLIIEYKKIYKNKHTYLDSAFINLIDGRLHGQFNQFVTVTGRLSSSNPNLQNIPKPLRRAIIPPKDYIIIAADYSQCEIRILGHLCSEPSFIDAFSNNEDIHVRVAQLLLGKQNISEDERRVCKTLNFGVLYGMQKWKLSTMLSISLDDAEKLLNRYWQILPIVKQWLISVYLDIFQQGYVSTILGRRRYLLLTDSTKRKLQNIDVAVDNISDIIEALPYQDSKLLREAGNAPIQGSNADLTKLAMVALKKKLRLLDCVMVVQIHDEIVFYAKEDIKDEAIKVIKHTMENCLTLNVPLKVDVKTGYNMYDLNKVENV